MMSRELAKNTNFSHYRIVSKIGVGGMGEVYLAVDTQLERKVAVKFLKDEFSQNADKLSRFVREAKAISALNHPNILTVFEVGETDGKNYIATEFIEGKTLRERLIKRETLNLSSVLNISIQVAEALAAAHQAGIVHRDIKPENIMIRQDGYAKVLDFGLAKLLERKEEKHESEDDESTLILSPHLMVSPSLYFTNPGMVLGTVSYMSPEQARGKETDGRTDIWSLGVVLYEMLSGRLPFAGETTNHTIVAILEKEPLMLEDVPDELQRIIRKSLTKDKEMRYQTARDFLIDLKNLRRDLDIQGELERSASPNRSDATYSLHDSATQVYLRKSTEKTHGDPGAQARTTVRLDIGGVPIWAKALAALLTAVIIGSAAWWFFGRTEKAALNTGLLKSVGIANWSSGPNELSVEASFSPDAKMIAFGSARSGATEIWIKPVAGGEAIQVTKNGFYNQYPVWSPNGQEIAFFSNRGDKRGIWRTSFTGGEQTEISDDFDGTAKLSYWAESGKIYFQSGVDLFAADEKTGETKRLTDFQNRSLQPRHIEISKDETKVAYSIKENDLFKIRVKRLDAELSAEIAASKDQIDYLTWHPNGDVIYSATVDGTYHVFKVSEDGGQPTQLSTGDFDFLVEDVSRDGERVLYWSQNETSDLWMVNIETGRESLVADDTASEYWAAAAPDGKSVVYQSVNKANRPFSGTVNVKSLADASSPLTVSANGFSPVWSKDGKWLAFFKRSEKEVEIWRVESAGGTARKLASGVQSLPYTTTPYLKVGTNQLSVSPDGGVAYAARRDGKSNIWLVSPDGSSDKALTRNEDQAEWFCCPVWTPDGSRFVVSSTYAAPEPARRNTNRLRLYAGADSAGKVIFETGERIRLLGIGSGGKDAVIAVMPETAAATPTPDAVYISLVSLETGISSRVNTLKDAYFHNIHLSPDGKTIAFVTRQGSVSEIWVVPVNGGAPRKAAAENNPKVYISSLSWSPDGKSIYYGKQTQNSLLSMLTN